MYQTSGAEQGTTSPSTNGSTWWPAGWLPSWLRIYWILSPSLLPLPRLVLPLLWCGAAVPAGAGRREAGTTGARVPRTDARQRAGREAYEPRQAPEKGKRG
jgi:hypothetical protein